LDEVLTKSWPHVSGMPMQLQATCIDAGYAPSEVTQFTRHRHGQRVYACKGASSAWGRPIWPRRPSWDKNKHAIYVVSADEAKLWVANRMRIEKPGKDCSKPLDTVSYPRVPGYMHTPVTRARDWYEMLTCEKLVLIKGQRRWVNALRARNEAFDCRCLAVAALHSRMLAGLDLNAWCDQFAALLAPPKVIGYPMTDPPKVNGAPAVVRSRWMDF
jgi:phage terminase large subunit GpA-like protein